MREKKQEGDDSEKTSNLDRRVLFSLLKEIGFPLPDDSDSAGRAALNRQLDGVSAELERAYEIVARGPTNQTSVRLLVLVLKARLRKYWERGCLDPDEWEG